MRHRTMPAVMVVLAFLVLAASQPAEAQEAWPPIQPVERAMMDCPQQPGAPAIFLYREESTDHNRFIRSVHCRLKVLTAAGKDRACKKDQGDV